MNRPSDAEASAPRFTEHPFECSPIGYPLVRVSWVPAVVDSFEDSPFRPSGVASRRPSFEGKLFADLATIRGSRLGGSLVIPNPNPVRKRFERNWHITEREHACFRDHFVGRAPLSRLI